MPSLVTLSVGATARDYATLAALITDIGVGISNDLVADDENWVIEMYNDAEFTYAAHDDFNTALPAGKTDATRNIVLRPASGEGFMDSITASDALEYFGTAKGVAIRSTTNNFRHIILAEFMTADGLQFTRGTSSNAAAISDVKTASKIQNCIIDGNTAATSALMGTVFGALENVVLFGGITSGRAVDIRSTAALKNVTVIRYSDASASSTEIAFDHRFSGTATAVNCVATDFNECFKATGGTLTLTKCASTDATGSSGLQSLTAGDLFEGLASSAPDARIKSTGALDDAGGAGGTSTDILGTSRVGNGDIGAFELVAAGGAIMNQLQGSNMGADLYNGTLQ